jgi:chromate transporter
MHNNQQAGPGLWSLFCIWTAIGLQSFGGGSTIKLLIQRIFIERYGWLTIEEFNHFMGLCALTPGVSLISMTILIGRKLAGWRGMLVSLLGMLLPSVVITCLLAMILKEVERIPSTQSVMSGILPATAAIILLVGLRMVQPEIAQARRDGRAHLVICVLLVLGCFLAIVAFQAPVFLALPGAGLLGILFFAFLLRRSGKDAECD